MLSASGRKRKAATPAPVQTLAVTPARAKRSTRKHINYNEAEMAAATQKESSSSEEEADDEEERSEDEENLNPNPDGRRNLLLSNSLSVCRTPI